MVQFGLSLIIGPHVAGKFWHGQVKQRIGFALLNSVDF
jgi:hypothetical protein